VSRRFLFLQGPHGPFFRQLAAGLTRAGASCRRIAFNRGDRVFWQDDATCDSFHGEIADWPAACAALLDKHAITDLVLYGDTRPVHRIAIDKARARGITVHVFEEGYLRPWWITYERGGANAHSPLMSINLAEMRAALDNPNAPPVEAPGHWGSLRRHSVYGALYHGLVLSGGPKIASHRDIPVAREMRLHLARLLKTPIRALGRRIATARVRRGDYPYHLVLLQLDHDASFRDHGPFPDTSAFLETVISGFAEGAPPHHHLVFKAHPLEDGRIPQARLIRTISARHGLSDRIHYIAGGKLARLLDTATSAVTVNSTAAQQALWRGLPVKAFGRGVYTRPEFVSAQPTARFFADPQRPDRAAYDVFRQFLLETSQLPGSFYAARGRRQLCRKLPDLMLSRADPYAKTGAAQPQHLHLHRSG